MGEFEDNTLDDIKKHADEDTAEFIDQKSNEMLELVKQYESEQDYWFVYYYLAQSFSMFTLGATAANINEDLWIEPGKEYSKSYKARIIKILKSMSRDEIWDIFKGREELACRLFGYGTHLVHTEMEKYKKEEEKKSAKRKDWTYTVLTFTKKEGQYYSADLYFSETLEDADRWFEYKNRDSESIILLLHVSPKMKFLLDRAEKTKNLTELLIDNRKQCSIIRQNERSMEF